MPANSLASAAACLCAVAASQAAPAAPKGPGADPRLSEVRYDPAAVVTVPVKRGIVTHVVLDPGESITDVASGLGADCGKPESSWCIAAQPGGHHIFVKPKSAAQAANNLAVVTDRRAHAFRFVLLADGDSRQPVYRLTVLAPSTPAPLAQAARPLKLAPPASMPPLPPIPAPPSPAELVVERMSAAPTIANSDYAIAEGAHSADIVPTLVFDDGRFTYLRFPNNREVPAVFQVLADGTEALVNVHMQDDLLVVDRVSRRLNLRSGNAVVGVWNEAFDLDGVPPRDGTTVPGVSRALKYGKVDGASTGAGQP